MAVEMDIPPISRKDHLFTLVGEKRVVVPGETGSAQRIEQQHR
jgi:hypothetical protein